MPSNSSVGRATPQLNANPDTFISSVVPWVRLNHEALTTRLNEVLSKNRSFPACKITFRPDTVMSHLGNSVPASAQQLIKWDHRHPHDVFVSGLRARINVATLEQLTHEQLDIDSYITKYDSKISYIFVSAAMPLNPPRSYDDPMVPEYMKSYHWSPLETESLFRYEIFAYGGIDVNSTLGNHEFKGRHEVVFPGGIRPEFIRSAREYDGLGRVLKVWVNGGFNIAMNEKHSVGQSQLPWKELRQLQTPLHFWTGHEVKACRMPDYPEDPMRWPDRRVDKAVERTDIPPRSCFLISKESTTYFFMHTQYMHISSGPYSGTERVLLGPFPIMSDWESLRQAKFAWVDAVLPSITNTETYYFFCEKQCAKVKIDSKTKENWLLTGPTPIYQFFPALEKAGFETVDAVMNTSSGHAYFFRGRHYVYMYSFESQGSQRIALGPSLIMNDWQRLGFETIDAILPIRTGSYYGYTYIFSGNKCAIVANMESGPSYCTLQRSFDISEWKTLRDNYAL